MHNCEMRFYFVERFSGLRKKPQNSSVILLFFHQIQVERIWTMAIENDTRVK